MDRLEPEVLQALGDAAVERGIDREVVFEALEAALEAVKTGRSCRRRRSRRRCA